MSQLKVKDLINAGLFSVLLLFVTFAVGMTGFIPIMMWFVPFISGLLSGPIYMLYTTKIKKFGMIMITGVIYAIVFSLSGHGIFAVPGMLLFALLAEGVLRSGAYRSLNYARLSYMVFCLGGIGNFLPIMINRDQYAADLIRKGYGAEYAETFMKIMPNWAMIVVILFGSLGAFIGCTLGIKMLKKHFEKAGMV